jgi:hypothetical protein
LISEPPQSPSYPSDGQNGSAANSSSVAAYVSSVRAQRSQGRADAVLNALERLSELSPHPAEIDIKSAVQEALGEAPVPPTSSSHMSNGDDGKGVGAERLELLIGNVKRAVIKAKVGAEEAARERERSDGRLREVLAGGGVVPVHVKVKALERARADLITWVEGELSKVRDDDEDGEEEEAAAEAEHQNETHEQEISVDIVNARVQAMYDGYISARQALVSTVEAALQDNQKHQDSQEKAAANAGATSTTTTSNSNPSSPQRTRQGADISALILLPHLPQLISNARTTAALLQQTSHLRRSLQQTSASTASTIQRLAGESHLVAPDATEMIAWTRACQDADEQTREAVREQINTGRASVERAGGELAEWKARRDAIHRVKSS